MSEIRIYTGCMGDHGRINIEWSDENNVTRTDTFEFITKQQDKPRIMEVWYNEGKLFEIDSGQPEIYDPTNADSRKLIGLMQKALFADMERATAASVCIRELHADVRFLAKRQLNAAHVPSTDWERETGVSSNCIVAIAYGVLPPDKQVLPSDADDLAACERMWAKLPAHRKTEKVVKAMERARNYKTEWGK
jgi:hypothetical protein